MTHRITKLQIQALVLWSQNFTIKEIAQKMGVGYGTIKERITVIKRLYPESYGNTKAIRETLKRNKKGIIRPLSLSNGDLSNDEQKDNKFVKHITRYRDLSYDEPVK